MMMMFVSLGIHEVNCDLTSYGSDGDELTLAIVNVTSVEPFTGFASNFRDDSGNKFSFGNGKVGTVSGILIRVLGSDRQTNDACEPISTDQWSNESWIVLAKYGGCKDDQKLRNIAKTNASAALIYDYKSNPRLIKLQTKRKFSPLSFPFLFVCLFPVYDPSWTLPHHHGEMTSLQQYSLCHLSVQSSLSPWHLLFSFWKESSQWFLRKYYSCAFSFVFLFFPSSLWLTIDATLLYWHWMIPDLVVFREINEKESRTLDDELAITKKGPSCSSFCNTHANNEVNLALDETFWSCHNFRCTSLRVPPFFVYSFPRSSFRKFRNL